jgi:hypothetical protein
LYITNGNEELYKVIGELSTSCFAPSTRMNPPHLRDKKKKTGSSHSGYMNMTNDNKLLNKVSSLSNWPTGCRSLVVVLSLSKREFVSSSPARWLIDLGFYARTGRVKPKTFKIGSDCSFAKSTAFR